MLAYNINKSSSQNQNTSKINFLVENTLGQQKNNKRSVGIPRRDESLSNNFPKKISKTQNKSKFRKTPLSRTGYIGNHKFKNVQQNHRGKMNQFKENEKSRPLIGKEKRRFRKQEDKENLRGRYLPYISNPFPKIQEFKKQFRRV